MRKAISKALLRLAGWKIGSTAGVDTPKCVICVAPHTSNWDFVVGKLFYTAIGCNANFLIKKEWFFFPFNFNPLVDFITHRFTVEGERLFIAATFVYGIF